MPSKTAVPRILVPAAALAIAVAGLGVTGAAAAAPSSATSAAADVASVSWLASDFDAAGFGDPGLSNGDLDGSGAFLPRSRQADMGLVPGSTLTTQGLSYTVGGGEPGVDDHVRADGGTVDTRAALGSQSVAPATSIAFVGAGVNGTQSNQPVVLTLDDGSQQSTQSLSLTFTDWCSSSAASGNVLVGTHVNRWNGSGEQTASCGLWATTPIAIPAGKTLESVTLPANPDVRIFAIASNADTAAAVTTVATPSLSADRVAVGSSLSASVPTGSVPAGGTVSYEWLTDDEIVSSASGSSSYIPNGWDLGKQVTARAVIRLSGHRPATGTSAAAAVVAGSLVESVAGAVTGTAQVGSALTASLPTVAPRGAETSVAWSVGGRTVGTGTTYVPVPQDAGAQLAATFTTALRGYTVVVQAVTVGAVAPLTLGVVTAPVLSGAAVVGEQLTSVAGVFSAPGATSSNQWLRDGAEISGATAASYRLAAADAGHRVGVRVTTRAVGYAPVVTLLDAGAVATAASAPAAAPAGLKVARPVVLTKAGKKVSRSSRLTVKTVLKARRPKVTGAGAAKVTVRYQWLRGGKAVSGATRSTYRVVRKDRGKKLSLRVTVRASGHATVKVVSAKTPKVKTSKVTR